MAGALADIASIGITDKRTLAAAEERITQLQHALDSRIVIEQARAVLAEREALEPGEAFGRLRRYARARNERVQLVARRFLDGDLDARDAAAPLTRADEALPAGLCKYGVGIQVAVTSDEGGSCAIDQRLRIARRSSAGPHGSVWSP